MKTRTEEKSAVLIVSVEGDIDASTSETLQDGFNTVLTDDAKDIVRIGTRSSI